MEWGRDGDGQTVELIETYPDGYTEPLVLYSSWPAEAGDPFDWYYEPAEAVGGAISVTPNLDEGQGPLGVIPPGEGYDCTFLHVETEGRGAAELQLAARRDARWCVPPCRGLVGNGREPGTGFEYHGGVDEFATPHGALFFGTRRREGFPLMRARIIASVAVLLLVFAAIAAVSPGAADDNADIRLADLETRVAALETEVAAPLGASPDTSSQQSTSSSSTTSGNNAYTASFSGSGDREIDIEIDNAGTYQVTATASSAFLAVLEDDGGNGVPGFPIESDDADSITRTVSLEPGRYILRVTASDSWNLTIVLLGG